MSFLTTMRQVWVDTIAGTSGVQRISGAALAIAKEAPLDPGDFTFGPSPTYLVSGGAKSGTLTPVFNKNYTCVVGAGLVNDIFKHSQRGNPNSGLFLSLAQRARQVTLDPITRSAMVTVSYSSPILGVVLSVSKNDQFKGKPRVTVGMASEGATYLEFTLDSITDTTEIYMPVTTPLEDGVANALGIAGSLNANYREIRVLDKASIFISVENCDCYITPVYFQTPSGAFAASLLSFGGSESQIAMMAAETGASPADVRNWVVDTFMTHAKNPNVIPAVKSVSF